MSLERVARHLQCEVEHAAREDPGLRLLDAARELLLADEPGERGRDLRCRGRVVPRGADDLREPREEVFVQERGGDLVTRRERGEAAEPVLPHRETHEEEQGADREEGEERVACPLVRTVADCGGRSRAEIPQWERDHVSLAGRERGHLVAAREDGAGRPDGVECERHRDRVDHPLAVCEGEVMVEEEAPLLLRQEDVRERVLERVGDAGVVERRVRREPAAPAEPRARGPVELVHVREVALHELPLARAVGPGDARERELLSRSKVERALPAVPVAGEAHDLLLADVQAPVRVESRGDMHRRPGELARLRGERTGDEQRAGRAEGQRAQEGHGHSGRGWYDGAGRDDDGNYASHAPCALRHVRVSWAARR